MNPRVQRMRLKLQGYDFEIRHIKGKNNTVPDAFTRLPVLNMNCCVKLGQLKGNSKSKIIHAAKKKRGRPRKHRMEFSEEENLESEVEKEEEIVPETQPKKREDLEKLLTIPKKKMRLRNGRSEKLCQIQLHGL